MLIRKDKTIAKAANAYLEYYGHLYKKFFEHDSESDEKFEHILLGCVYEARHVLKSVFGVCSECIEAKEAEAINLSYGKNHSY